MFKIKHNVYEGGYVFEDVTGTDLKHHHIRQNVRRVVTQALLFDKKSYYYNEESEIVNIDNNLNELIYQGIGDEIDRRRIEGEYPEDIEVVVYNKFDIETKTQRQAKVYVELIEQPDNVIEVVFKDAEYNKIKGFK